MVREDLIFSVVTFMTVLVLIREILALVRHRRGGGGAHPA